MTDAKTAPKKPLERASSVLTPFPIIIGILLDQPSNSPAVAKYEQQAVTITAKVNVPKCKGDKRCA